MIPFRLLTVPTLASALAAATPQTDTIHKFYQALGTPSPTILTFTELFGGDDEAEVDTLLAIYYEGKFPDTVPDEKAVEFTRRANDPEHVSEFLICIRRLRPKLFSSNSMVKIETPKQTSDESFDRIFVTTRGGKLIFLFGRGEKTIENITMPDGSSVSSLIPQCGRRSPGSRSGESRGSPK